MPTNLPRHAITETDDIRDALDIARTTWPELADRPAALLRRLILTGRNSLAHRNAFALDTRNAALQGTAGAMAGVYGPDFLTDLRNEDWPD